MSLKVQRTAAAGLEAPHEPVTSLRLLPAAFQLLGDVEQDDDLWSQDHNSDIYMHVYNYIFVLQNNDQYFPPTNIQNIVDLKILFKKKGNIQIEEEGK